MPEPVRKRRRAAISCALCRRRKLRCNKETPCSNCIRSKNLDCFYERNPNLPVGRETSVGVAQNPTPTLHLTNNALPTPESSHQAQSPNASISSSEVDTLRARIRELEGQLSVVANNASAVTAATPNLGDAAITHSFEPMLTGLGERFGFHHDSLTVESSVLGHAQPVVRGVTHKNRVFGQSHWSSTFILFRDIIQMIEPHIGSNSSKLIGSIKQAKIMARAIKAGRTPEWPTPLTSKFPLRQVCDQLVQGYLRTIETVFRIVHVPTFQRDYEDMWTSDTEPSDGFKVQLKLIMAIGASVYNDNFSMRTEAIRWVHEAQAWIAMPTFKSRLGIQFLQNYILLLIAREIVDVGGELVWISAGGLVRTAVYMGLHKDPVQLRKSSVFEIEMRLRLWNTILELSVQTSLVSGGLPFISLSDFNTEPPNNFDDEQLTELNPIPRPDDQYTSSSVAIALRRTLPARLAVVKFLNDLMSLGTYEATLRIDAVLRSQYKELKRTLQNFRTSTGSALSQFELHAVDFLLHRYLTSIHQPYYEPSLRETAYAFSRKVVIESSLKIWSMACRSSNAHTPLCQSPISAFAPIDEDFPRICRAGSGFFFAFTFQASTVLVMELRAQLQEDDSISTPNIRPDLFAVMQEAPNWYLRCIEAGETGVKGYILHCIVGAQIDALLRNMSKEEMPAILIKAAEDAEIRYMPLLEKLRAQQRSGADDSLLDDGDFEASAEFLKDWELIMSEGFNLDHLFA